MLLLPLIFAAQVEVVQAPATERRVPVQYDVPLQNCHVWESADFQTWTDVTNDAGEVVWVLNEDGEAWDLKVTPNRGRLFYRISGEPL